MNDIISHIRANQVTLGIDRKTAKNLYIYGANKQLGRNEQEKRELEEKRERLKKEFDEKLWPL